MKITLVDQRMGLGKGETELGEIADVGALIKSGRSHISMNTYLAYEIFISGETEEVMNLLRGLLENLQYCDESRKKYGEKKPASVEPRSVVPPSNAGGE